MSPPDLNPGPSDSEYSTLTTRLQKLVEVGCSNPTDVIHTATKLKENLQILRGCQHLGEEFSFCLQTYLSSEHIYPPNI